MPTQVPELVALEHWADELKAGMLVAVVACTDERRLEGTYWLAKLLTGAYELQQDISHSGNEFKEGWLIAEVPPFYLHTAGRSLLVCTAHLCTLTYQPIAQPSSSPLSYLGSNRMYLLRY